jgi:DNA-binding LacI/PurR family transcriptional regulator
MKSGKVKIPAPNGNSTAEIADYLRAQIVSGDLLPGAQLPTQSVLQQRFGASSVTIQRAFDVLAHDDFIQAFGRRGTYVVEAPPHLSRYALVFRHHPHHDAPDWTTLYTALIQQAASQNGPMQRIEVCAGVTAREDDVQYTRLVREVRRQRLAGLIFVDGMRGLENTPLLCEEMPRVLVASDYDVPDAMMQGEGAPGVSLVVSIEMQSLIERAVEHLHSTGKRRISLLSHRAPGDALEKTFLREVKKRRLQTHEHWLQSMAIAHRDGARRLMQLLVHRSTPERPDALIITDDNLVQPATRGLHDAGVKVPSQMTIVAHANFPLISPGALPFVALGVDTRALLEAALQSIERQRREKIFAADAASPFGKATTVTARLPMKFANEVSVAIRQHGRG